MLDMGYIGEVVDSQYRKDFIYSMYAKNQWEQDEEYDNELKKLGDVYAGELVRLIRFLEGGEPVGFVRSVTCRSGFLVTFPPRPTVGLLHA